MWPLTGGCHYSGGCERYLSGCGSCPQLASNSRFDISWWQWRRKRQAWKDVKISVVAVTLKKTEMMTHSTLTGGHEVPVIPNASEVERFSSTIHAAATASGRVPQAIRISTSVALTRTKAT